MTLVKGQASLGRAARQSHKFLKLRREGAEASLLKLLVLLVASQSDARSRPA